MVPCLHLISLGGWVVGRCSVSKQGVAYTLQPNRIRFVQYSLLPIRIEFVSCIFTTVLYQIHCMLSTVVIHCSPMPCVFSSRSGTYELFVHGSSLSFIYQSYCLCVMHGATPHSSDVLHIHSSPKQTQSHVHCPR